MCIRDSFLGLTKNDLFKFAELIGLVIIVLLVIILVIRPLLSRVLETTADAASGDPLLADQSGDTPALTGPGALTPSDGRPDDEQFEELIDIDRVEGRVKASAVKSVGEIVDKHPDEALSIVRGWMYQEN